MKNKILVINGPNLQLLGAREPEVYGTRTLKTLEERLDNLARELCVELSFFQSNHEGSIVDCIGESLEKDFAAIIINPAAYTHTSIAIYDALKAVGLPAIEVHLSNIAAREDFRQHSISAKACVALIAGLGFDGYEWALRSLAKKLDNKCSF